MTGKALIKIKHNQRQETYMTKKHKGTTTELFPMMQFYSWFWKGRKARNNFTT